MADQRKETEVKKEFEQSLELFRSHHGYDIVTGSRLEIFDRLLFILEPVQETIFMLQ